MINNPEQYLDDLNGAFSSVIIVIKEAIKCKKIISDSNRELCDNIINNSMHNLSIVERNLKSLMEHNLYLISLIKDKENEKTDSSN